MNVETLLQKAKFERCGAMHGVAYVHPETMEVSPTKKPWPWVPVRPTPEARYQPTAAGYLASLIAPPLVTEEVPVPEVPAPEIPTVAAPEVEEPGLQK